MENKSKRVALRLCFGAVMAFGLGALSFVAVSAVNMAKLHVDSFTVVGIETRTSNAREMSGDGPIGKLWAHLRSEDFLSRIPDRELKFGVALILGVVGLKELLIP